MHFEEIFDIGIDYGADGGHSWDTQVLSFPNGATRRNQQFADALGRWQLGNRNVRSDELAYIRGFLHAMRGRMHSFLYKDWNDYIATQELLAHESQQDVQLTKTYGLAINGWSRAIKKPSADGFVLESNTGSGWVVVSPSNYDLDTTTGIVSLDTAINLDSGDGLRWTGFFYVPARFDRDMVSAQFLGLEQRASGNEFAYAIGDLSVVEDAEA
jgi:uncharacterized protein (TIGR02217 family)